MLTFIIDSTSAHVLSFCTLLYPPRIFTQRYIRYKSASSLPNFGVVFIGSPLSSCRSVFYSTKSHKNAPEICTNAPRRHLARCRSWNRSHRRYRPALFRNYWKVIVYERLHSYFRRISKVHSLPRLDVVGALVAGVSVLRFGGRRVGAATF